LVRMKWSTAMKGVAMTDLDPPVIFKTALDRSTGFIIRWRVRSITPDTLSVELVDADTGSIYHEMRTQFELPVRLSSPDRATFPAKNKAISISGPGHSTFIKLLRLETPTEPGAPITDWQEIFAEISCLSPTDKKVPKFQIPSLATPKIPTDPQPSTDDGH
jgi:hypothetical protein